MHRRMCWEKKMTFEKDIWKFIKKETRRVKGYRDQSKNEANKQFGGRMNQDVTGNRKF